MNLIEGVAFWASICIRICVNTTQGPWTCKACVGGVRERKLAALTVYCCLQSVHTGTLHELCIHFHRKKVLYMPGSEVEFA
jgi:hypothetical protein